MSNVIIMSLILKCGWDATRLKKIKLVRSRVNIISCVEEKLCSHVRSGELLSPQETRTEGPALSPDGSPRGHGGGGQRWRRRRAASSSPPADGGNGGGGGGWKFLRKVDGRGRRSGSGRFFSVGFHPDTVRFAEPETLFR